MGMKFHKLYVTVLNPLAIILIGLVAVVLLLGALNIDAVPAEVTEQVEEAAEQVTEDVTGLVSIPLLGEVEASDTLWVLFGLAAVVFLFMLLTEFLLVARRKFGIVLLSLSLLLGIASNIVGYLNYTSQTPWYTMLISVVVSALVLLYYWKRYPEFT